MDNKFSYVEIVACSDPGCIRENNEDAYAVIADDGCFFVADGMGGGDAGEIASDYVKTYVSESIENTAFDCPGLRKYNVQQAIHKANKAIRSYAEEKQYRLMGSTLALCLLNPWNPESALVCHVGDSRVYCLREGELFQITTDHTIGSEMAKGGAKSKEFRNIDSKRRAELSHVLTRAIGTSGLAAPEWDELALCPKDRILVCSDGITTMLDDKAIADILSHDAPQECMEKLKKAVIDAGALDNLTIIIADISETLPEPEIHDEDEIQESEYLTKIAESRVE